MQPLQKYPRTYHIEGSRRQAGDGDIESVPFSVVRGRNLVVEEKMDGANSAISFTPDGRLLLQSRGHYLTGGARERHFNLFKQWAHAHADRLRQVLQDHYVLYGEWLHAKHTIFYNHLPHYFLEFDVLDIDRMEFLDTPRRLALLKDLPVVSALVLHQGPLDSLRALQELLTPSHFIRPGHVEVLRAECVERGLDPERTLAETDRSAVMEGLYIKVEEGDIVKERYKYVRSSFLTTVLNAEGHWLNRPIIPNRLRDGVDLFA